jgi:hypothetical protein
MYVNAGQKQKKDKCQTWQGNVYFVAIYSLAPPEEAV